MNVVVLLLLAAAAAALSKVVDSEAMVSNVERLSYSSLRRIYVVSFES